MVGLDLAQDGIPAFGVETRGGLVQHQHPGLHGHDTGDGHPALLAAGKLKGALLQQLIAEAHKSRRLLDAALHLGFVQPHVAGAVSDILGTGFLKKLVLGVLHDQPHQKPEGAQVGALGPQVLAIHQHPARNGAVEAVEMADQGGFAAAGGADDANEIPLFHREGDVLQRGGGIRHAGVVYILQMFYTNDL